MHHADHGHNTVKQYAAFNSKAIERSLYGKTHCRDFKILSLLKYSEDEQELTLFQMTTRIAHSVDPLIRPSTSSTQVCAAFIMHSFLSHK